MTVLVRDFLPADAEAWVRVRRETLPFLVTTAEQVAFDLSTAPDQRYRPLVAEEYPAREGALRVYTWVLDEPANRAFAEKRGYAASRSAHFLHLDLANGSLPPPQEIPAGVELRTAADFSDDPRPLGTRRAFRGRGLAKLAKNDSPHRARAAGYRDAYTGNDTGNGPMPAVNKWFGYRICATEVRHVRKLAQQR